MSISQHFFSQHTFVSQYTMIVVLFVFALFVAHILVKLSRFALEQYQLYQALKCIPGPEIRMPLFGNINLLLDIASKAEIKNDVSKEFNSLLVKLCDEYGANKYGLVRLWLGPFLPIVIICDAKAAQTVLNSPHYVDKASFYGIFRSAIGDGIFTCNATKLKVQKKNLRDHFKIRALERYMVNTKRHLNVFNERVEKCIKENDGVFPDVKDMISPFVLDVLGENLFSTEFNSQKVGEPKFVQMVHTLLEISYRAFLHPWTYFFSNAPLRYLVNFATIKNAFRPILYFKKSCIKVVKDRYAMMVSEQKLADDDEAPGKKAEKSAANTSLLDMMIAERVVQSKLTRVSEIDRQISTFVIAGHDTTTSSLTWSLYLLGHHQEVQTKLRQEIDAFTDELRASSESLTLLNIKKLKYLDCVIKESLRLYPSGPFIGRRGRQPVAINDQVTLPANINVIIFINYMHTREEYFRQPHRFYPERFLPEKQLEDADLLRQQSQDGSVWANNSALMPFSAGLRVCIGKEYGIVQQKLFLINLLSKYTFKAMDTFGEAKPKRFFLLSSAHFPIKFQPRSDICPQVVVLNGNGTSKAGEVA